MKSNVNLKQHLYEKCAEYVNERLSNIHSQILEIQESLTSETKSSAGDKHETGRAMLHLEREKAGKQLSETEKLRENLSKIDFIKSAVVIGLGSVVFTSSANYYIGISAGLIEMDGINFFAISPNTPIALLVMGKTIGDEINFREQKFVIESVL